MIHLIIGGARSGKSSYAESLALNYHRQDFQCHYVATAMGSDDEMQSRIERHQQDRDASQIPWITHEHPVNLQQLLTEIAAPNRLILVDCLTLWLTNELLADQISASAFSRSQEKELAFQQRKKDLLVSLEQVSGAILLVSNEVGSGIVPLGTLSRQFVDEAGWLNQAIAKVANQVTLVVAGLPLCLKG